MRDCNSLFIQSVPLELPILFGGNKRHWNILFPFFPEGNSRVLSRLCFFKHEEYGNIFDFKQAHCAFF